MDKVSPMSIPYSHYLKKVCPLSEFSGNFLVINDYICLEKDEKITISNVDSGVENNCYNFFILSTTLLVY